MDNDQLLIAYNNFFPGENYFVGDLLAAIKNDNVVIERSKIVNALQGALHDEKVIEVEFNNVDKMFFCRVLDQPPEPENQEVEVDELVAWKDYIKASYLEESKHVIITPLEPWVGNFLLGAASQNKIRLLLRIITTTYAYEFGCFFEKKIRARNMPVLQISFPVIARKVEGAREYRAKIPKDMNFEVLIGRGEKKNFFSTRALDISPSGMGLIDPMGKKSSMVLDEKVIMELRAETQEMVSVEGIIRHVTKLRDAQGMQYCFGVHFNLDSRSTASKIEKLVSFAQRIHIRELSQITNEYGVDYSNW